MILDMGCAVSIEKDPNVIYGNFHQMDVISSDQFVARKSYSRGNNHRSHNFNNNNHDNKCKNVAKAKTVKSRPGTSASVAPSDCSSNTDSRIPLETSSKKNRKVLLVRDLGQRQQSWIEKDKLIHKNRRKQNRKARELTSRNDRENLSISSMSRSRATSVTDSLLGITRDEDSNRTFCDSFDVDENTIQEETPDQAMEQNTEISTPDESEAQPSTSTGICHRNNLQPVIVNQKFPENKENVETT